MILVAQDSMPGNSTTVNNFGTSYVFSNSV